MRHPFEPYPDQINVDPSAHSQPIWLHCRSRTAATQNAFYNIFCSHANILLILLAISTHPKRKPIK